MARLCSLIWCVCVGLAGIQRSASAATFAAPLHLSEATAPEGSYLTAAFDFGLRFAEIDSVSIEFVMSEDYHGTALATSNSVYTRDLHGVLHEGATPMRPVTNGVFASPFGQFGQSKFRINAGELAEFEWRQQEYTVPGGGGTTVYPIWPEFLFSGRGQFSLIDIFTSSFNPIGNPELGSSTTTWTAPAGLESATLTIVATPIPEPSSALLALIAGAAFAGVLRLRR